MVEGQQPASDPDWTALQALNEAVILARKEAAFRMVCSVAKDGGQTWRMCVPPQPTDSDMCIIASLADIPDLLAENARLRAALPRTNGSLADRERYRIPHADLVAVREPWPLTRLRGLRIYLGW